MTHAVITANRLRDGVVVWFDARGRWAEPFAHAAVFAADEVEAALTLARSDVARQVVVGVYKAGVILRDGVAVPDNVRETIRSQGPSVRLDLGIQALHVAQVHVAQGGR